MKICLVCSSGGHFLEMWSLRPWWSKHDRVWATFRSEDTAARLAGERVAWGFAPTQRHARNFLRNFALAFRVLRRERPDVVVSTGAGVGVPFLYAARALGLPTIYIESLTRTRDLSLSGRLVYPVADKFYVQWPGMARLRPRAEYRGQVLERP